MTVLGPHSFEINAKWKTVLWPDCLTVLFGERGHLACYQAQLKASICDCAGIGIGYSHCKHVYKVWHQPGNIYYRKSCLFQQVSDHTPCTFWHGVPIFKNELMKLGYKVGWGSVSRPEVFKLTWGVSIRKKKENASLNCLFVFHCCCCKSLHSVCSYISYSIPTFAELNLYKNRTDNILHFV